MDILRESFKRALRGGAIEVVITGLIQIILITSVIWGLWEVFSWLVRQVSFAAGA